MQIVGLPQVLDVLLWHEPRLLPALLQLAELGERMVDGLVRIDQLLQLLDDPQLDLQVLLLLGLDAGDELVAAAAVLAEQILETGLGIVHRGHELLGSASGLDERPAGRLVLGAMQPVEGDLQRLHVAAQRLHGTLLEHPGEQLRQLGLALAVVGILHRSRLFLGGLRLLGHLFAQLQTGRLHGQRRLLVREIHARHRLLVRPGGNRRLVRGSGGFGRGGIGGQRFGRHVRRPGGGRGFVLRRSGFDNGVQHILSRGADSLLGSRRIGIFSSHLRFSF